MDKKPYYKIGDTYYPKGKWVDSSDEEVKGNWWRAWLENGKYYYEFDEGYFSPKMRKLEISINDFKLLKDQKITNKHIENKYK